MFKHGGGSQSCHYKLVSGIQKLNEDWISNYLDSIDNPADDLTREETLN